MRKFNNNKNLSGEFIKEKRLIKKLNRTDLARELQLIGLNATVDFIYRVETNRVILKDFELIAFAIVLELDLNDLKKLYIDES